MSSVSAHVGHNSLVAFANARATSAIHRTGGGHGRGRLRRVFCAGRALALGLDCRVGLVGGLPRLAQTCIQVCDWVTSEKMVKCGSCGYTGPLP